MIEHLFAAVLMASADPGSGPIQQTPPPVAVQADDPVSLEDVTVTGRPLDSLIRNFVNEVAEPNRGRGLARWDRSLCVGVSNLREEAAQYLADRVSTVAEDLGLEVGRPGCRPNLLIVATDDGQAYAETLAARHRHALRMGGSGMDRGAAALRDFISADRPVRWWQVSMPTDSETGARAVRLAGDCDPISVCGAGEGSTLAFAPQITTFAASRLTTQIVDNIVRTVVVVDVDEVSRLSIVQLADYIAMVSLAQIDPDADTSAYSSILNVFDAPQESASLTNWDQAYLLGLYGAERTRANHRANNNEIARTIHREHGRLRAAEEARE